MTRWQLWGKLMRPIARLQARVYAFVERHMNDFDEYPED